ncbi:uncharacterized protein LOC111334030 [Stylophora pistillata]|uniref:uncharacterized protein LOC111334030 n=1 Tax=Stylophora pistillata TaxID=50429 RepID=UPI000C052D79|nr:uncharacterized protein LOC111334030 [Stylophora pistillata]
MSAPRADQFRSSENKPVIGLRPIRERNKRSEALIEEQLVIMRETQNALQKTLQNLEKASAEDDHQKTEKELEQLFSRSGELLLVIQVLMKIRNELAHARLDLERAIKVNSGVDAAKKRVKWLQDRLEKVLLTAKSYCHLYNRLLLARSKTPELGLKDQISEKLWNILSDGQQQLLLESEKRRPAASTTLNSKQAAPIVKEIARMQLTDSKALGSISTTKLEEKKKDEHPVIVTDTVLQTEKDNTVVREKSLSQKRKQRKRSHGSKGGSNQSSFHNLMQMFPPTTSQEGQSDQESDTTAEPESEPEDFDDQRSVSVVSSVGINELEALEADAKDVVPAVEVSEIVDMPFDTEDSPESKTDPVKSGGLKEISTAVSRKEESENMEDDDKVAEYWHSDHHKFEWSNYMQSLDARSWHALGLGVPESFLSKDKPNFDPELPWKEKPMKVNSVIDVHKIALDKLLLRLHKMYEAIGQATQTTIDPTLKDQKIETVMGKLELEVEGGSAMEKQQNPKKLYPQPSSSWCEDFEGGYRMPRIFKVKSKQKIQSIVQPHYLPRKEESPKSERQAVESDLANTSLWRPAVL